MKNLKQWKTTLMGIILLMAAAADLWHFEKMGELAQASVAVVGILFLFAPDKILNILIKKADK